MSGPPTTSEEIVANAGYHSRLLQSCSEVEYAPSALKQHDSYIKDLEGQLDKSNKKVEELAKVTKKERKEHEKLRDSTARRFAAKLSGKREEFEAREMKEEKEYVDALQNELVERDQNATIQQLLSEARHVREDLVEKSKKLESLKTELDSLYSRVFDGPSESFPEEDRLEYDLHAVVKQHEEAQMHLNMESQAAESLSRAVNHMERCEANVKEALSYSSFDMFSSNGIADLMERNALTNAQAQLSQARSFVEQAQRINPIIPPLAQVGIASGSWATDVFFDNPISDYSFHQKIKRSGAQVLLASAKLKEERNAAVQRAEYAGGEVERTGQHLQNTRKELFNLRKVLFESVAAGAPRPPSYDKATAAPPAPPPKGPPPAFPSASPPTSFPSPYPAPAGAPGVPATSTSDQASNPPLSSSGRQWGSRNPYAAQLLSQNPQPRDEASIP